MNEIYGKLKVSIFLKTFFVFLGIIIPVYLLYLVISARSTDLLKDRLSAAMYAQTSYYLNSLENEIKGLLKMQQEFAMDKNLRFMSVMADIMTDIDIYDTVTDQHQRLMVMSNSNTLIDKISIYIPAVNSVISNRPLMSTMNNKEYEMLLASYIHQANQTVMYWDSRPLIVSCFPSFLPIANQDGTYPHFLIAYELSKKDIQQNIAKLVEGQATGAVLFNSASGFEVIYGEKLEGSFLETLKQQKDKMDKPFSFAMGNTNYISAHKYSELLDMDFFIYLPERQLLQPLEGYKTWFLYMSFVIILAISLFTFSMYKIVYKPIHKLTMSFKKADSGDLDISIKYNGRDEFSDMYGYFNNMITKYKNLIHNLYEQKIMVQKAELKHLQSQINPHFLYNGFFLLYRMAQDNNLESIKYLTQNLGRYYQFVTRSAGDEIPLHMEVQHALVYADIQNMRFSDRIHFECRELPDKYSELRVPKLIIQPLIENAYEHGLSNKMNHGLIRLSFREDSQSLSVIIEDNGEEFSDEQLSQINQLLTSDTVFSESTALLNVHHRLRLKYQNGSGLYVKRGSLGGLEAAINIVFPKVEDKNV